MIPEDVCTYVYVYIMEISEYFIDAKGCMYIEQGNRWILHDTKRCMYK